MRMVFLTTIWGLNDMVQWLNTKHGFHLEQLCEPDDWEGDEQRTDAIVEALKTLHR